MFFLISLIIIIIALILMIIFSNFEIEVKKLEVSIGNKIGEIIKPYYRVLVRMYILKKVKLLEIDLTKVKLKRINMNFKNVQNKILKNKNKFDAKSIKLLKNLKIKIKNINLNTSLGLENAATTAILVGIISSGVAILLEPFLEKRSKVYFDIQPIYQNKNMLNISFEGIFTLKMIHIINTYKVLIKKRRGDKNVRTSNRRSYAYNNG